MGRAMEKLHTTLNFKGDRNKVNAVKILEKKVLDFGCFRLIRDQHRFGYSRMGLTSGEDTRRSDHVASSKQTQEFEA